MSRVQPANLSNEELLQHVYMANYNVSVDFVKELHDRFAALLDTTEDDLK